MKRKIPLVVLFDYEEANSFKFVQLYIKRNMVLFPSIRFENAETSYHASILEKMLLMNHITNFDTRKIRGKNIPEIKKENVYEAVGMGRAVKEKNNLYILANSESYDYEIGFNKEHLDLVSHFYKIKLDGIKNG